VGLLVVGSSAHDGDPCIRTLGHSIASWNTAGLAASLVLLYLSFLYLTVLVMALGAIQGLRVTWLRSRWKAILILFFWLAFPLVETFSISRDPADFFGHLYSAISLSPSWGLAAWVTHRVARRLASPQDRSVVTADAVATDLGERASGLKHANIPELILLTVITLGLYYPVWFLRRRPRLNELESGRKLGRWPFVFALLFGSLRVLVSGGGPKVSQLESTAESLAFSLFTFGALAVTILMVVQCFFVKDMIEDHLAGAQEDAVLQRITYESVKLSSVLTLCFGIFYLQYKINQRLVAVQNGLTRR